MKISRLRYTAVAAAMAALSTAAWPQAQPANQATQGTAAGVPAALDMRASQLIGKEVRNAQGQDLGEIQDLIIDVNNQRVHYAVLAFGGFLGLGEKLFAYPVRTLQTSGDQLVLNVPKERLQRAPGFDPNRWPNWSETIYRDEIDRYFGPTVSPKRMDNMRLVRASELIGKDVNDRQGDDAGEIEDIVVNLNTSAVRYVVLDFDKAWSPDDKMVALPVNTLSLPDGREDDAVLNIPRERVNMSAGFDENAWPDINDPEYRDSVDQQLPTYRPWTHTPNQILGDEPPRRTPQQ